MQQVKANLVPPDWLQDFRWQRMAPVRLSSSLMQAAGIARYFTGLFLLCWLGGWSVGFSRTVSTLVSGGTGSVGGNGFLIFWLGGWTAGGLFAMLMLYRAFRPSVPESLQLKPNGVEYDSGIPPFQMNSGRSSRKDFWRSAFPKRACVELNRRQLQTLRLRDTESGNRLTIDAGAARLDVAQAATEIEREWLYRLLAERYALPVAPVDSPGPAARPT